MKTITTIKEAKKFLENKICDVIDITKQKYHLMDKDENLGYCKNDKELIEYANEQKEAIEN